VNLPFQVEGAGFGIWAVFIAIVGIGLTLLTGVLRFGRWMERMESKLAIMSGKMTAITRFVFGLTSLLSRKGVIDAEEASRLFADYGNEISKFEGSATNPITPDKARRRRELSNKLDNNTITLEEAKELKAILEEELA
jgi:hypothetical protein